MRKKREPLTQDLTPLIDVVFLLLIFFLVSAVFKDEDLAILLQLPKTDNVLAKKEKSEINIELNETQIALNGEIITSEQLDAQLFNEKNKKVPIILKVDNEVTYQKLISIIDIFQKHNLVNFSMVTKNRE
ncbi:MAG: biopolymer transporter ExbD [Candidatus Cloacimonadales bacterium]